MVKLTTPPTKPPKKSTWRDEQTQTNKKQNKETKRKQTNKNSRFRNNKISVLF
jgi:hypothetical protein